ncbi:DUF2637 domain-containing protein [Streptomyces sp. HK10]|uniref:DUF2637 domain-containing protein n=1 Tax=Streptomyces sp. HK10 TaxID=3373255 RepID=UPI003748A5EF
MTTSRGRVQLTLTHRVLIAVVVLGAVTVAGIGFAGSYSAVSELAERKGFGAFAPWFPIGVDVSIIMLLALDLLLDFFGMALVLLRYTAWFLSAATMVFNSMAAYPDPLGMAMHGTIPVAFLAAVEAGRRAISRLAGLSEDRRMDSVRVSRWLLAPLSTALLWRRMKLWELRSYDAVIKLEQERLVYRARLKSRYGRGWRRKAPVESLMPLRLARYGVPLSETAPAGLAAAGIEPGLLPVAPAEVPFSDTGTSAPPGGRMLKAAPQIVSGRQDSPRPETEPAVAPSPPTGECEEGRQPDVGAVAPPRGSAPAPVPGGAGEPGGALESEQGEAGRPEREVGQHAQAIAGLKPADAVRYAIRVLGSADAPTLTRWLKEHGKPVNSGQVWRIAQKAKESSITKASESSPASSKTAAVA